MVTRRYNRFLLFSVLLVVISLVPLTSATLSVTAFFNQSGISGTISFTQEAPDRNTTVDVNLTGKGGRGEIRTNCLIKIEMGNLLTYFPSHLMLSRLLVLSFLCPLISCSVGAHNVYIHSCVACSWSKMPNSLLSDKFDSCTPFLSHLWPHTYMNVLRVAIGYMPGISVWVHIWM